MATYTSTGNAGGRIVTGAKLAAGSVLVALLVALIGFAASGRSGGEEPTAGAGTSASPAGDIGAGGAGADAGDPPDSGSGRSDSSGSGGSDSSGSGGAGTGSDETGGDEPATGEPLEILELSYSARVLDFDPSDPGNDDFTPAPEVRIDGRVIDPASPLRGKRLKTARFHFGDGTDMEPHFNTNHARFRVSDTGYGYRYDPSFLGQTVTLRVVMYGHAGQMETREVTIQLPAGGDDPVHGSFE